MLLLILVLPLGLKGQFSECASIEEGLFKSDVTSNDIQSSQATGVYLLQIDLGNQVLTKKLYLIK